MAHATRNITKRVVDALQPGDMFWDGEVRGFGVRRQRRDRVYVLKYSFKRRQRWLSIGKHGSPWTVEKARLEAKRLLGLVAAGNDPAKFRDEAKYDITVNALCELYIAEGCATKKHSTLATDRGRIERHIKPLIGKTYCRSVTRSDVERMMQDIANGKTACDLRTGPRGRAIVKGGRGTATKAVHILGAIFTFAVSRGLRPDNPVRGVKTFRPKIRERFLSAAEFGRLGEALSEMARQGASPSAVNAIRLLIMTGCRKSEVLTLKWSNVDFERSCFRLPDSKTGEKVVPIGSAVLKLLAELPRVAGNDFVLPGTNERAHFVGLPKVWRRARERAGLNEVRLHDLRHSYASVGAAAGDSLIIIGKLLGHQQVSTTARYAHLADDPLKAAADRISAAIAAAMNGTNGGAEVIGFPKRNA